MANTAKVLVPGTALSTLATLYTVPAATKTYVGLIRVTNTTQAMKTFRLYLVPNGGSAGAANAVAYDFNVPAAGNWTDAGGDLLDTAGDTIQASGDAGLSIRITGVEMS